MKEKSEEKKIRIPTVMVGQFCHHVGLTNNNRLKFTKIP